MQELWVRRMVTIDRMTIESAKGKNNSGCKLILSRVLESRVNFFFECRDHRSKSILLIVSHVADWMDHFHSILAEGALSSEIRQLSDVGGYIRAFFCIFSI